MSLRTAPSEFTKSRESAYQPMAVSGLIAIALAVAVIGSEAAAADPFGESRGLWISRFDYGDP
ncbi:MAG: hypothetical protein AAF805_14920, partial [Planctomycetota bacterium]